MVELESFPFPIYILMGWNIMVFVLYGLDKNYAKRNMWRFSEKFLIGVAVAFGGVGAFIGMRSFRHKTKHKKFQIIVPITAIFTVIVGYLIGQY